MEPSYACQHTVSTGIGRQLHMLQSWGTKCAHLQALLHCMKEGGIRVLCVGLNTSTDKQEGQYDIALLLAHP